MNGPFITVRDAQQRVRVTAIRWGWGGFVVGVIFGAAMMVPL